MVYLLDDGGEGNALEELVKGNGDEEGLVLIIGGHSQRDTNNDTMRKKEEETNEDSS